MDASLSLIMLQGTARWGTSGYGETVNPAKQVKPSTSLKTPKQKRCSTFPLTSTTSPTLPASAGETRSMSAHFRKGLDDGRFLQVVVEHPCGDRMARNCSST